MVLIQIDLPDDLDRKVKIKGLENGINKKPDAVVHCLMELFNDE